MAHIDERLLNLIIQAEQRKKRVISQEELRLPLERSCCEPDPFSNRPRCERCGR